MSYDHSRHSRQRHSPSTSDSSVEESWREDSKDSDHWRRKKSKVKRRSRIQRQRSYHEDLEANGGPTGSYNSHSASGSKDDDDDEDIEPESDDRNYTRDFSRNNRDQLDVPGHSKILRHHSWDSSLTARRYSSESSDVSDVGGDCPSSLDQDELVGSVDGGGGGSGGGIMPGGSNEGDNADDKAAGKYSVEHPSRLGYLKPRAVKKLARKKPVESEEDYDAEQSANMESSPSPENSERHSFPRIERRTSSEDSDVFKGNRSRRSSQNSTTSSSQANWPGKIPIVEVHAAEHDVVNVTETK